MAKVLQENVKHNGEFYEKGTKFDSKNPAHKEMENIFGDGSEKVSETPATGEGDEEGNQPSEKTKAMLLEEIKTAGATDEEMAKYEKLNKADLLVVYKEIVG